MTPGGVIWSAPTTWVDSSPDNALQRPPFRGAARSAPYVLGRRDSRRGLESGRAKSIWNALGFAIQRGRTYVAVTLIALAGLVYGLAGGPM